MTRITQKRLKEVLHYNPETGDFTWKVFLGGVKTGDIAGCKGRRYRQIRVDNEQYMAHCLIWLYVHGDFPEDQIDHINHDGFDNRLVNLRAVTQVVNHRNRSFSKNNTSGVMGVHWYKSHSRWRATIMINGKHKYLGLFKTISEAVSIRKKAEVEFGFHENHGKLAT